MIKCVLFDCDGLMFETELVTQQMWRDMTLSHGIHLPEDFFLKITGASTKVIDQYFEQIPGLKELLPQILARRFDLSVWGNVAMDAMNKKGLIELFQFLEQNVYLVGICSSSNRQYVETLISRVSYPLHYETIVCGDMVKNAKPSPEIFLTAANILNVKPNECLVLEDSKQGILAAHHAGMHHCFIQDTISPDAEFQSIIEYQVDNLNEVITLLRKING